MLDNPIEATRGKFSRRILIAVAGMAAAAAAGAAVSSSSGPESNENAEIKTWLAKQEIA